MQTTYTYPSVEVNMCLNLQLKTWGGTESGLNHLKNPRHTHGWYIDNRHSMYSLESEEEMKAVAKYWHRIVGLLKCIFNVFPR